LWPCVHYLVCHNLFAFTNCQPSSSTQRSNRWWLNLHLQERSIYIPLRSHIQRTRSLHFCWQLFCDLRVILVYNKFYKMIRFFYKFSFKFVVNNNFTETVWRTFLILPTDFYAMSSSKFSSSFEDEVCKEADVSISLSLHFMQFAQPMQETLNPNLFVWIQPRAGEDLYEDLIAGWSGLTYKIKVLQTSKGHQCN
jgi:hypothetical protein